MLEDYPRLLRLNMGWNKFIKQALGVYVDKTKLEDNFKLKYGSKLKLVKSYLSATPL